MLPPPASAARSLSGKMGVPHLDLASASPHGARHSPEPAAATVAGGPGNNAACPEEWRVPCVFKGEPTAK